MFPELPLPAPLLLVVGGAVLVFTGDRFVEHAAHVARRFRVPKPVVGAVILGFGTSLPELLVCLNAAGSGSPGAALGNAVGSNIANIGLILGVAAFLTPVHVSRSLLRTDLPLGAFAAVLLTFWVMSQGNVSLPAAVVMLGAFSVYLWRMVGQTRTNRRDTAARPSVDRLELPRETEDDDPQSSAADVPPQESERTALVHMAWVVFGMLGVVVGAEVFVDGATGTARLLGVPDEVIGLSLMALGTSLPELATTIASCRKGEAELAIGNVAGSNLFNLLFVLGTTAVFYDLPVSHEMQWTDFPALCTFAILAFPLFNREGRIGRVHGGLLLGLYATYTIVIFTQGRMPA